MRTDVLSNSILEKRMALLSQSQSVKYRKSLPTVCIYIPINYNTTEDPLSILDFSLFVWIYYG